MMDFTRKLLNDETGATAIEYGLIAALIAIGIIGAVAGLRDELTGTFNNIGDNLANPESAGSG